MINTHIKMYTFSLTLQQLPVPAPHKTSHSSNILKTRSQWKALAYNSNVRLRTPLSRYPGRTMAFRFSTAPESISQGRILLSGEWTDMTRESTSVLRPALMGALQNPVPLLCYPCIVSKNWNKQSCIYIVKYRYIHSIGIFYKIWSDLYYALTVVMAIWGYLWSLPELHWCLVATPSCLI